MAAKSAKKSGTSIWKMLRWVILIALVLVIVLMLQKPTPPSANTASVQELVAASKSFDAKLMELEQAHQQGTSGTTVEITENELNGLIQRSAGQLPNIPASDVGGQATPSNNATPNATGSETKSAGKAPQIAMAGDEITGQFIAQPYGKDVYVTISARLSVENGHLVVHPTSFKIGILPIPVSLAGSYVQKKLADQDMQDKTKLPDFIKDVRVENGKLVISS